jgi:hypothetical protein
MKVIKAAHTIVRAFFVGCILAIPLISWRGEHRAAASLAVIVSAEVVVLILNYWRCPHTSVAARYTDDQRENFDIYLPEGLVQYNKLIFGTLYFAGAAFALTSIPFVNRVPIKGVTMSISRTRALTTATSCAMANKRLLYLIVSNEAGR